MKIRNICSIFVACCMVLFSFKVHAGPFRTYCKTEVSCPGLINDIVTEKFTTTYPEAQWLIFIDAHTYAFGDGTGASHATVGVSPKTNTKQVIFPAKTTSFISTQARVKNAYERQKLEREVIRLAVEELMAKCEDSPKCALD